MQTPLVNGVGPTSSQPLQSISVQEQGRVSSDCKKLIESLGSDDPDVRFQSTVELIDTPQEGMVPPLLDCLISGNAYAKKGAAHILGFVGDDTVIRPLVDSIGSGDLLHELYSVSALGKLVERGFSAPFLEEIFVRYLTNENLDLQRISSFALARLRNVDGIRRTIDFLKDVDPDIRIEALNLLRQVQHADMPQILSEALSATQDETQKCYLTSLLGDIADKGLQDKQATKKLNDCLSDSNPSVRRLAAESLAKIKDPDSIEPLISCLVTENDDDEVVFCIALALCSIKDPTVAYLLVKRLVSSLDNVLALSRIPAVLKSIDGDLCAQGLTQAFSEDETRQKYLVLAQLGVL